MIEHQDPQSLRARHVAGPFDLTGTIDVHLHSAPCMFPRLGDDLQMAQNARDCGMRAIVLKSHHENTVSRAYHAMMAVPGVLVIGGVTLNQCVGGINPAAVEAALKLGGKVVWGPTGHACYHGLITGEFGKWGVAGMELPGAPPGGISVLEDGKLIPAMIEVLDLVKKYDGVFCTSHLSPEEILKVVEYCARADIRVLVNHIYYFPRVELDFAIDIANKGAFIEFCSALVIPSRHRKELRYDYELLAETVRRVGASRCVMSTDAGGLISSLFPHEQFRMFGQRMLGYDVSREDVRTMMCDNPAMLLGLTVA
jgi:hypothetical protein